MSEQDPREPQPGAAPPPPAGEGPPSRPGYGQGAAGAHTTGYGQPYAGGPAGPVVPAAPRRPLDLAHLVSIAAWVVLGLFGLWYLYFISSDDNGGEFIDRFFGGMDRLGEGLFYAGVLHAVSLWLRRNQDG
jgi:hypothetical protein